MNRDQRFYNLACMVAQESQCYYRMGAIITNGARVIAIGVNKIGTHPKQQHYGDHVVSIHAEIAAIIHAKTDLSGMSLYVARIGGKRISKPCKYCLEIVRESGIRRVIYYDEGLCQMIL